MQAENQDALTGQQGEANYTPQWEREEIYNSMSYLKKMVSITKLEHIRKYRGCYTRCKRK